ncbi:hypothetical protein DPEC_G00220510 [Dallia pectoralis]|uniref:Uncharacterized protein n=1 Tax=Dallia pectoralis TaxID=75939 RepID=A0ACC2G3W1_DALPE|nr:hypothetical protein DPEC_G00220510 [Dallia pectoralis]
MTAAQEVLKLLHIKMITESPTSKTKELVVDFRCNKKPLTPITIQGNEVEVYKYLGVPINNKLGWAGPLQKRTVQTVIPEETQVLQRVHDWGSEQAGGEENPWSGTTYLRDREICRCFINRW